MTTRRLQREGGAAKTSEVHWTFSKSKHPRGGLIRLESVTVGRLSAGSETDNLRRSFVTSYVLPDFQIDREGQFVALVDPSRAGQLLRTSTIAALPRGMDLAVAEKLYNQMFSDEVLSRSAANNWSSLVSGWRREGTVRAGQEQKITNEVPFPMVGTSVTFENVIQVVGPTPCQTEMPPRCVWLEGTSTPSRDGLASAYAQIRERNLPHAPALAALGFTYHTELIIEPGTLVPHWYRLTKATDASVEIGGQPARLKETEERTDWFNYEPVQAHQ